MKLPVMQVPVSPVPSSILLTLKVRYDAALFALNIWFHIHTNYLFHLLQVNQAAGLTTEKIQVTTALSQTAFVRRKRHAYV
jgi:hypothetical protein